ncbi:MAG: hypothetical protein E7591_01010 [Ruminococcaceae bacterium]|nr:hypothetical protein [Oscillospiraceae bacterium]
MKEFIEQQLALYPESREQDVLKAVYQSVFGCGHFVYDEAKCKAMLEKELRENNYTSKTAVEDLGRYSRVYLSKLKESGISSSTLLKLFILSAKEEDKKDEYIEAVKLLPEICKDVFDKREFERIISTHIEEGCPSLHHSELFREKYHPCYRVILSEYADIIPLLCEIEKREECIVAIDGKAASGKSTLGKLLSQIYSADLIHMDDYFLPPERKTKERLSEAGGNVDYERFACELLVPLVNEGRYISRPYRCHGGYYEQPKEKKRSKITVIEGSYSLHPELYRHYDIKIFIDLDPRMQSERIKKRDPEMYERFISEWIPLENRYFEETNIEKRCDIKLISKKNYRMEVIKNEK